MGRSEPTQSSWAIRPDNHKVIWCCPPPGRPGRPLAEAARQGCEEDQGPNRGNRPSPPKASGSDRGERGWGCGGQVTCIWSRRPRRTSSTGTSISPSLEVPAAPKDMQPEYCGIMLKWVGDRLYYNMALWDRGRGIWGGGAGGLPRVFLVQQRRHATWAKPDRRGPAPERVLGQARAQRSAGHRGAAGVKLSPDQEQALSAIHTDQSP